ncbi:Rne/Rng family ribonuclease [Solwaraspora sp. WMMD406]|uniref:Rne/Rng family ribonuclease n=1 Tax=Solwaraspora sp. WMMD406 TaxID=3016095 RepID=UPI0024174DCD|nr:Rne/Rng family ribonuclease [Solwaraspora sp. WMMD406]MDG4764809.1 Rne/Rng family ribonuclease [Solwaraspora sp. WMMD406]
MLDNEPEGGDLTGVQPVSDTTDTTRTAPAKATRRRSTKAAAAAEAAAAEAAAAEAAAAEAGGPSAGASSSGDPAGGEPPAAPKTRRRRTTAVKATSDAAETSGGPEPTGGESAGTAGSAGAGSATSAAPPAATAGEPASGSAEPVKKVTRRRKKVAEPVVVPVEESEPAPGSAAPALAAARPVGSPVVTEPPVGESAPTPPGQVSDESDSAADPTPPTRRRRTAAASPPVVLFMAPDPQAPPPAGAARPSTASASSAGPAGSTSIEPAVAEPPAPEPAAADTEPTRRRRRGRRSADGDAESVAGAATADVDEPAAAAASTESLDEDDDDDDDTPAGRRRRRRGRRGRGRGKGGAEDDGVDETEPVGAVDEPAADDSDADADGGGDGDGDGDGLTRRRRRRRRRGAGDPESGAEDGVPTVVKIREPRKTADEVQGVSGSTRLEAKRQRRRDGREQRRTRPPILSESEFLARREAVDRDMVVRQRGDRTQIAVLEDGVLVEHYVTRATSGTMAGNVYLGKVQNVLPSMEAAFVDVGRGRNAVLYAGEVNWDATGLEGRARSIEQALRSGDSVLVQVTKDPIGHKGARLTSHIALSGRHLVYVPNGNASGISRKLPDTERKRLRDILKKLVPDGAGVIVRTAAEGASEDELARDVKRLQAQWDDIRAKATGGGAPTLLYEEPDLVIRVVRDLFNEDFRELVVEGDTAYEMVESYLAHVSPDLLPRLRRHAGVVDIFAERRIDEQILKGLDRKVFLPSGGHLVIDRTEAMTVIDVNTGKYTGAGGNLEETVTRNNLEAAEEIVRQLRLRDIGGIVVIDFIDMVLESNRELVLRRLTECLGRDRTKHQVTEITSLGLVQMTRKRIGAGLLEAFSETCDCCKGRGLIIHTEPAPDKPRAAGTSSASASAGAGDKVRAVAAATAPVPVSAGTGRRRGRKAVEPVVDVVDSAEAVETDRTGSAGVEGTGPAVEIGGAGGVDDTAGVHDSAGAQESAGAAEPTGTGEPGGRVERPAVSGLITAKAGGVVSGLTAETDDEDDTMGYDLSRYEVDLAPDGGNGREPTRLAGDDDPDLAGDDDPDRDAVSDNGSVGRRRVRRGGTRRRTRP